MGRLSVVAPMQPKIAAIASRARRLRIARGWFIASFQQQGWPRMDYTGIVASMRRLALEAGAAIMEVYARADVEVRSKEDASPVTEADEIADGIIARGLAAAAPGIPVITEEQRASHGAAGEVFFLVDPLDGTKEFIQRRGDFTVNIALIARGAPIRGVVYAPARGRLFYTDAAGRSVEEAGPHAPDACGVLTPLHVSAPDPQGLVVVASKSHRDKATDDYIARYPVADFTSAGSSLKFCLVACGEADLYPRLGRTMEWDTAAGHAVLQGAGGEVVRFDDHRPLTYGKPGLENPFFIAFSPGVTLIGA
jgi:3'(2'), 5'-bisphosphate nucleotidase